MPQNLYHCLPTRLGRSGIAHALIQTSWTECAHAVLFSELLKGVKSRSCSISTSVRFCYEPWYSTRSCDNAKILLFMSWSQSRAILIWLESICILFDVLFFCFQVQAISKNVSECSTRTDYCLSWSCVCDTTQGWPFFLSEFSQTSEIHITYLKRFWRLKCIRWFEKYHGSWL